MVLMAEFTATVHQNEFLPDGGTDVHAIVSVTCTGAGTVTAMSSASGEAGEIIIVDVSGSMDVQGVQAAAYAASAALDQIVDGVWFAIVAGNHEAALCYPTGTAAAMARMSPQTRLEAKRSLQRLAPGLPPMRVFESRRRSARRSGTAAPARSGRRPG